MTEEREGGRSTPDSRREDRRQAILDAAETLFLEQGFERVSLSAIVARSGGSLATVYDLFGNKHGLLHAVVARSRDEGLQDLKEIAPTLDSPADVLRLTAYRYHQYVTAPRTIAFMRLVIAESLGDAQFGQAFHQDMLVQVVERLADAFREWSRQGKMRIDDPQAAAELYFATVMCDAPIKAMLGATPEPTSKQTLDWRLAPFLSYFKIA